jgi:hypothetical protein
MNALSRHSVRLLTLVGLFAAVALPNSAAANTDCTYATVQQSNVGGTTIDLGVQAGSGGLSDDADTAAGVCVDGLSSSPANSPTDGGAAEVGVGLTRGSTPGVPGVYGVVDGDDNSTDPTPSSQLGGYFGLSNFESGATQPLCAGTGGGTNSGGCLFVKPLGAGAPVPLVVCGNTSGKAWARTGRDGCSIP